MKLRLEQDIGGLLPEGDFGRRDFIWTALGASAALTVSAPASAQLITTDTNGIEAGDVSIPVANGPLRGYRAMPLTNGPFPVVLVAAEIFGLNHYTKDICRRLAKAGYYAIVPDLYSRKVDLTTLTSMAEIMPISDLTTIARPTPKTVGSGCSTGSGNTACERASGLGADTRSASARQRSRGTRPSR